MRFSYPSALSSILLLLLAACGQNGGIMPINGKNLLETLEGPKIPSMADTQKEAAKNAEKNGNFMEAAQIYQQILEKDPDNKEIIQLLGDSFRRNGDYDKAISVYDSLLARNASDLAAKEGKGLALLGKGDFETPTALFEEVLKEDGKRWKSLNGMGILFVTRGLYPDSLKYFSEALKQNPHSLSAMNNMGLSLALDKQFDQSISTLSKASALSEAGSMERKRIDLNLALAYASAGNLDEARKLAEIYFSGPHLNNNLGLYAHLAKDDKLAKSYLNMALTESKTYYGKAWENLESLKESGERHELTANAGPEEKAETVKLEPVKAEPVKSEPEKAEEKKADAQKSKPAKAKPHKEKPVKKPAPQQQSVKPETGSLGKIIADELQTDSKEAASSPTSVMPNVIKDESPTPESIIDNIAKKPETSANDIGKSLGTIRVPATKTKDTGPANTAKDGSQENQ